MSAFEIIHDASTGEITERLFTKSEMSELQKKKIEQEALIVAEEAQLKIREAVLAKLGITEEEAKALLA